MCNRLQTIRDAVPSSSYNTSATSRILDHAGSQDDRVPVVTGIRASSATPTPVASSANSKAVPTTPTATKAVPAAASVTFFQVGISTERSLLGEGGAAGAGLGVEVVEGAGAGSRRRGRSRRRGGSRRRAARFVHLLIAVFRFFRAFNFPSWALLFTLPFIFRVLYRRSAVFGLPVYIVV